MATTFVDYTGDGNATKAFSFPSYKVEDIKVKVDDVLKTVTTHYNITGYTTTGGGNVVFTSGNIPASPADIHIYRDTDVDSAKATYTAGSSVKADDLNDNHTQLLYALQEEQNQLVRTGNIKDGAVTSAKIKDNTIVNADVNASAAIVGTKIDPDFGAQTIATTGDLGIGGNTALTGTLASGAHTVTGNQSVSGNITVDGTVDGRDVAADGTKLDTIETNAKDDQTAAEIKTLFRASTSTQITNNEILTGTLDNRYYTETELDAGQLDNRYYTETELNAGQLDNRYYTETELTNGALDGRYFTETESDARYFNISSGETIKDGDAFPDNDTTIATTAAINDRIVDLVDDVGGFTPIANETSFPAANPDVNNGPGTIVSIREIVSTRTPSGGVVTIANGAGSGNTVTIVDCGTTVLTAGYGVLVETTSTLHNYQFHRLSPKTTEVTTVAGISGDITTVAGISSNVTTVADNDANVTTVAGSIANVNTAATNIASINNASANIASVNNFGDKYQVASSNPSTDGGGNALAEGDLYFNTTADELKVYNGSAWQGGVTATGSFATVTGNTFTGQNTFTANNTYNDSVKAQFGTGADLAIYHNGTAGYIDSTGNDTLFLRNGTTGGSIKIQGNSGEESIIANHNGSVELYHDNAKKLETASGGVTVTGTVTATTFVGNLTGNPTGSGANLTSLPAAELTGTIADARFPATLPAVSAANLTSIPAANITGTLPAINGANLTGIDAGATNNGTIFENLNEITTDYTITANSNGFSMGPMTITNSTVTVGSGETYTIL